MKRLSFGFILVMSVPIVAAVSSISGFKIAGLEYKGFLWSGTLAMGFLLVLIHLALHKSSIPFPFCVWFPWFLYGWISLLWGGIQGRYSLQNPGQIMTPFVVGILASLYFQNSDQLSRLIKAFKSSLIFIAIVFVFFWYGPGESIQKHGIGYGPRTSGLTLVFLGGLFLSGLRRNVFHSVFGWIVCLIIVTLSGSRMATLSLLLLWCVYPSYKRTRSRFISFLIIGILAIGLFYTPIFQKRFFESGTGSVEQLAQGEFSGSGRFQFWPMLWQIAQDNIILGGGAGYISVVEKDYFPGGYEMPSNDYLRILIDYGAVGLLLFLVAVILQLYKIRKIIGDHPSSTGEAFIVAYLGFFALLVSTITENTMTYVLYFMNPLFVILGAAYGVQANETKFSTLSRNSSQHPEVDEMKRIIELS